MLSDRERRALAVIEQQLAASDPEFVRTFRGPVRRPAGGVLLPRVLLVLGLALVVLGSATVALAVAALGTAVTMASLVLIARRDDGAGISPAT